MLCHTSAYNRNLCHVLKCCSYLNTVPQLKPKLNNAETKKPFHEFSFIKKAGAALVKTITSTIFRDNDHQSLYKSIKLSNDIGSNLGPAYVNELPFEYCYLQGLFSHKKTTLAHLVCLCLTHRKHY